VKPPFAVKSTDVTYKGFIRDEPDLAEKKLAMYQAWFLNRQKLSGNISTSNGMDKNSMG